MGLRGRERRGAGAGAVAASRDPTRRSAREAADLLNDAWTDPEWGLLLWLTMITGLRRGELSALRWRHLDLDRANLWVEIRVKEIGPSLRFASAEVKRAHRGGPVRRLGDAVSQVATELGGRPLHVAPDPAY